MYSGVVRVIPRVSQLRGTETRTADDGVQRWHESSVLQRAMKRGGEAEVGSEERRGIYIIK
jgi:hypothetical protein